MKKQLIAVSVIILIAPLLYAFCGFYVSKADATLKNKASQVILVRDGNRNVITMYNDYRGDIKDFAMVVPVPVVLKKSDIRVVDPGLFKRLNDYSAPRLVEYYDQNPCEPNYRAKSNDMPLAMAMAESDKSVAAVTSRSQGVKIEAQYVVGEYDILILSATESLGLKDWLVQNGYRIPKQAEEVLDPYIKSNLKFFVVKVNAGEKRKSPEQYLRPIQISFTSPKFMLPIRLGMANADGDQDLLVYAFTRKGRIECTNYRNVDIPTDRNVPLFIQKNFNTFYENLFTRQWRQAQYSASFLEYAWDVTPANYYHCDPCIATAPSAADIVQAGVWWLNTDWTDYRNVDEEITDPGNQQVHFTRLHFRYNRNSFAQDLQFQVTPNTETFQARYVITHPARGRFSCEEGKKYLTSLRERRKAELEELNRLTGKTLDDWQDQARTVGSDEDPDATLSYTALLSDLEKAKRQSSERHIPLYILGLLAAGGTVWMRYRGMI
jgi:hypothetical protein